ncbi:RNA-splicing factor [Coemansia sp. RSA 2336]|nr:RNA-splicing factor [Coemansia sp. RSA 2336]
MYNGIGLSTPRGSGTSGHVVKNVSSLRPGRRDGLSKRRDYSRDRDSKTKPLDKGIIDHERKRQVEVQCLELQDRLEDRGVDEAEIEDRVNELRSRLLQNLEQIEFTDAKKIKSFETQKIAEAKAKENRRMARALRVEEDYAEGASFDRELQELRRQKRMLEKERDRELAEEPLNIITTGCIVAAALHKAGIETQIDITIVVATITESVAGAEADPKTAV